MDSSAYNDRAVVLPLIEPAPTRSPLWNVRWRGFYQAEGDSFRCSAGHLDFALPGGDGVFSGSGLDSLGPFTIFGKREGSHVAFTKTYSEQTSGREFTYEGFVGGENDTITGDYCFGRPVTKDTTFPIISSADSAGTFSLHLRPLYYFSYRPHQGEFDYHKPRALWKFALNAVLHAVRIQAKQTSWDFFRDRRDQRRKYAQLYMHFDELFGADKGVPVLPHMTEEQCLELANLETSLTTADLLFYRSMARCAMRRRVIHLYELHWLRSFGKLILFIESAFATTATPGDSQLHA